ncbi:MAG: DNA repair protein RadC [Bacteroidia bacterium]
METNTGIKTWAEDDRPREKLLKKGARELTDSELLAIFIRTGSRKKTAVDVARELLQSANNDLDVLGKLTVQQMLKKKISGLGSVKAITIVAALELGRRRRELEQNDVKKKKIITSKDAYDILVGDLEYKTIEEFWILLLDRANHVMEKINISKGGITGTVADAKIIFRHALDHGACGIILCHNHPSGNTQPSQADLDLTRNLKEGGKHLDINIHDHIIIAGSGYSSFNDEGWI